MKTTMLSFGRPATVASLILLSALACPASNLVVSNLSSAGSSSADLTDSSGMPLAAGCQVQFGTFPGLDAAGIAALAEQGSAALLQGLSPFGPAFEIGTGAGSTAGQIEVTANQAVGVTTGGLYAVILNAPGAWTATEILVLKLADSVPADDASSLPGYLAVHLRDAEVVFGT